MSNQDSTSSGWQPIQTRPDGLRHMYLVANARGQVAPWICGIIHNDPAAGTQHDWQWGEAVTHWMPLPPPPSNVDV
jgi:hypothetical protein